MMKATLRIIVATAVSQNGSEWNFMKWRMKKGNKVRWESKNDDNVVWVWVFTDAQICGGLWHFREQARKLSHTCEQLHNAHSYIYTLHSIKQNHWTMGFNSHISSSIAEKKSSDITHRLMLFTWLPPRIDECFIAVCEYPGVFVSPLAWTVSTLKAYKDTYAHNYILNSEN